MKDIHNSEEALYQRARKRIRKEKGFYRHLMWYVIINLIILVSIAVPSGMKGEAFWNFWTFSTAFYWGIGLVVHGVSVFMPRVFLGKEWEERQIRKYMEKDREERWE
ncbi:2TM domain-containing protein [Sinomicrobium soli]|uniref:2TM domain-containing protein n=1 Tax=Sinomicrobium sp. N-1-3-6 TaxID=2219864 RepID=UPI000DCD78C5|nr:2TM domain-containing protein [Sinomicrobium sp. N-1-3-6]RAV30047.1 hypothetical protein DN748_04400 [Sinomicrobium sp. N-1-3-6]